MKRVDMFVRICIEKGYVSQERAEWLQYALEKRIVTLFCFVPLLSLGLLMAKPATVAGFFMAFCLLRTQTNGFHAKSVGGCLICSIIGEVLFLKILPLVWNNTIRCVFLGVSCFLIWLLAPYNHPSMDLSSEEIIACAKSAKLRLCALLLTLGTSYWLQQHCFVLGITLGIIMAALTLAVPYCL